MKTLLLKKYLIFVCVLSFPGLLFSQSNDWHLEVGIGVNMQLKFSFNKEKFPGIKVFANCIFNKKIHDRIFVNYGSTLSFYLKSLGNDLNPLNHDLQMDFTNSFSLGGIFGDSLNYEKRMRTINNSSAYNLKHNYDHSIIFSTIFILNNHKRNQIIGAINGTIGPVSLNYYNDSGFPIEVFAISDNFDRWWTGGTGWFIHTKQGYNRVEVSFDQFTGYSPLIYELTSIFGIDIPAYNLSKGEHGTYVPQTYNSSSFNVKVYWNENNAVSFGVIGSLRFGDPEDPSSYRFFSLQDMTHIGNGNALHPNNDKSRLFIGYTLNRFIHSQNLED